MALSTTRSGWTRGLAGFGLVLTLVLTLGACGSTAGETRSATTDDAGPTTLQPAAATSPPGTKRVVCALREDDGSDTVVRFALDLPDDVRAGQTTSRRCDWTHREKVRGYYSGYQVAITVSTADVGPTLQDQYDALEPYLVEDGDFEGDDTVFDLELDDGVAVFGRTVGLRFRDHCFCDGQNPIERAFQADGVRVTWNAHADLRKMIDRESARALRGAGAV